MSNTTKSIANLIMEMRKASGMSQMAVAAKMGVTYQQVQKYEKGRSKLSVPRLIKLADIFGVPITAFLEDTKAEARHKARFSNLSDDEEKLVTFFRRLPNKPYRAAYLEILKDIVKLADSTARARKGGTA